MSTHAAIKLEQREQVTVVSVDDGKANALNSALMRALRDTLREVAKTAGAVVLTGRAGFFSGGLDVKLLPTLSHGDRVEMVKDLGHLLHAIFLLERPVVAALSGHALGGGALMALAADARIAADAKLRFGLNEIAIGVPVPSFGVEIARAAVPAHWQAEAVLHGRTYSPVEALARGLVEAVVAPETLLDAAVARAAPLAALPTGAYLTTKQRLRGAGAHVMTATLDEEIENFLKSFSA